MNAGETIYLDLAGYTQHSPQKKKLIGGLGIAIVAISFIGLIFWVVDGLQEWELLLSPLANLLLGVSMLLQAANVQIKWMKQYILLDSEKLEVKLQVLGKPHTVYLKDINEIRYKTSEIQVNAGSRQVSVPFSDISYQYIQQLKEGFHLYDLPINEVS